MAKLYIEIDTTNEEDMKLFTVGRKGVTTLEMAQEVIDTLASNGDPYMISRTEADPKFVQEFEVLPLADAIERARTHIAEAIAVHGGGVSSSLIISALHVNEDERGN